MSFFGVTNFEYARLIGIRAEQIANGATPMIATTETDPIQIAIKEFNSGKIPLMISRQIGNKIEKVRIVPRK